MIDAAYFARALWRDGRQPDADRLAKAKKRALLKNTQRGGRASTILSDLGNSDTLG